MGFFQAQAGLTMKHNPDENFALFVMALAMIAGVTMLMWTLVRPAF